MIVKLNLKILKDVSTRTSLFIQHKM